MLFCFYCPIDEDQIHSLLQKGPNATPFINSVTESFMFFLFFTLLVLNSIPITKKPKTQIIANPTNNINEENILISLCITFLSQFNRNNFDW